MCWKLIWIMRITTDNGTKMAYIEWYTVFHNISVLQTARQALYGQELLSLLELVGVSAGT